MEGERNERIEIGVRRRRTMGVFSIRQSGQAGNRDTEAMKKVFFSQWCAVPLLSGIGM
jgi:hypothetical protein